MRGGIGSLSRAWPWALAALVVLSAPALAPPFKPTLSQPRVQAVQPEPAPVQAQPSPAPQQGPTDPALGRSERSLADLARGFTQAQADFAKPFVTPSELAAIRRRAEDIRSGALAAQEQLRTPIAERLAQLKRIGDTQAGQPVDSSLAQTRQQLFDSAAALEAVNRQLGLLALEAEQFLTRITDRQRDEFLGRLLEPGLSILNPALWVEGWRGAGQLVERLAALLANWWTEVRPAANVAILVLVPLVLAALYLAFRAGRRWFAHRLDAGLRVRADPDDAQRLWRLVRGVLVYGLATIAVIGVTYVALRAANVMTPRFGQLFRAVADFVLYAVVLSVAAQRLAAPDEPRCRILDLDDQTAQRFAALATAAGVVSALTDFLSDLAGILFLPISVSIAQSALAALLMGSFIAALILLARHQPGLPPEAHGGARYFGWALAIVPLIWLVLAVAGGALVTGYVALAAFITKQLVDTAFIVAGLVIVHHLTDAVVASSFDPQSAVGQGLRRLTGLGDRTLARLGLLLRTVIDLALILIGLPLLFLNWAVTWIDFGGWGNTLLSGVQIGDVTISLEDVLVGLAVLIGGWGVVKLFTLWLDRRVLARTELDAGVQNSIETGARYAGLILVAGLALSTAGLDFSNLALVAGALGVGIGFGLQSIVNNFVSGLILLAERPIKVGDWIVVSGGEGIVKRINVRSTEIETFDKCAIIVPNSSLISESVANWTHGDIMGRVRVPVGVSYDADAREVERILLESGRTHELVLAFPQPFVRFQNFGTSTLDFEFFGYIADVNNVMQTASEIRYEILRRFSEAGIEIPYAQSDVRVKGLDDLVKALSPAAASKERASSAKKEAT